MSPICSARFFPFPRGRPMASFLFGPLSVRPFCYLSLWAGLSQLFCLVGFFTWAVRLGAWFANPAKIICISRSDRHYTPECSWPVKRGYRDLGCTAVLLAPA